MTTLNGTPGEVAVEDRHLTHNRLCNAAGEGLWGMLSGLITTATVLPALLLQLKASDFEKGVLTSFELVGFLLPGLLGVYMLADLKRYKQYLVWYHIYICCPLLVAIGLLVQFSPGLPGGLVRWGVLVGFGLFSASVGFIAPTWFHWLAALFPIKSRGESLSYAVVFSALSSAGATFLASEVLEGKYIPYLRDNPLPYPLNFGLLFYGAAALGVISMVCFILVREPGPIPPSGVQKDWRDIFGKIRMSLTEPNFRRFLIGRIAEYIAITFFGFFGYYFMSAEGGGLSEGEVTLYGGVMPIMTAVFGLIAGRIGDRFGHKLGKVIGMFWMVAAFGLILAVPTGWGPFGMACWAMAIFALRGMFFGSMFSGFNFIFESCPHGSLAVHMTACNVVVSVFAAATGLLAGGWIEQFGHRPVYWAGLAISIFSMLWLMIMVKDPRQIQAERQAAAGDAGIRGAEIQGAESPIDPSQEPTKPK